MDWILQRVPEAFGLTHRVINPSHWENLTFDQHMSRRKYTGLKKVHTSPWSSVYFCERKKKDFAVKVLNIDRDCHLGASFYEIFVPLIVHTAVPWVEFFFLRENLHITKLCLVYPRRSRRYTRFIRSFDHIQLIDFLLSIVDCVHNMHHSCLMHLDIKSENFLFSYGRAFLIDHSLAILKGTQPHFDAYKTTSWYRPPEIFTQFLIDELVILAPLDKSADIWSLGMTLWDFLMDVPLLSHLEFKEEGDQKQQHTNLMQYFEFLIGLLGQPPPSLLRTWGGQLLVDAVRRLKVTPRDKKYFAFEHLRSEILNKLSTGEIERFVEAVWQCLQWDPKKRPSAKALFDSLQPLGTLHLTQSIPSVVPEVPWACDEKEIRAYYSTFDATLSKIDGVMPAQEVKYSQNPRAFDDARIIGYSLYVRVMNALQKQKLQLRFDVAAVRFTCVFMAIIITRPYFDLQPVWFHYEESSIHAIIMFVCYLLQGELLV